MNNIKILVAYHKPGEVYQDEQYVPIHVGRAVSKYKEEMADMIGDDTGDNISEKNLKYCELTAQYWAWKNLHDVEYIGFCHYRRFFNVNFSDGHFSKLLKFHDVITLKFYYPFSIFWEITRYISHEHLTIMLMVVKKRYPEYEQTMIDYLHGNVLYPKNMFICKKELFDQYAEWLFDILFECEKYLKPMPYTRLERSLAYMGEYLMTVYMMYHQKRIAFVGSVENNKVVKCSWFERISFTYRMLVANMNYLMSCVIFRRPKSLANFFLDPVVLGLKQDQINI